MDGPLVLRGVIVLALERKRSGDGFALVVVHKETFARHCSRLSVDAYAFPGGTFLAESLTSSPESKGVIIGLLHAGDCGQTCASFPVVLLDESISY